MTFFALGIGFLCALCLCSAIEKVADSIKAVADAARALGENYQHIISHPCAFPYPLVFQRCRCSGFNCGVYMNGEHNGNPKHKSAKCPNPMSAKRTPFCYACDP